MDKLVSTTTLATVYETEEYIRYCGKPNPRFPLTIHLSHYQVVLKTKEEAEINELLFDGRTEYWTVHARSANSGDEYKHEFATEAEAMEYARREINSYSSSDILRCAEAR